jgi:rhamnosyltransferase
VPPARTPQPLPQNVCAVFVTFHPDEDFRERVLRVKPQVGRVIVVDNGSGPQARRMLDDLARENHVELIALGDNFGLGTALNRGLSRAIEHGFSWGLTFDQDSLAREDLVDELVKVYEAHPERERIGVIGANYEEETTGTTGTPKRVPLSKPWLVVGEVITSGCLQSLAVFRAIGGYSEDLFIYFVDNEFCRRVRTNGNLVLLSTTPLIRHRTGNYAKHRIFGRQYVTAHYAPWRHYYIVRNGVLVARRHGLEDPGWALHWVRSVVRRSAISLFFEKDKVSKLLFMLRGAYDGLRGRAGKRPEIQRS